MTKDDNETTRPAAVVLNLPYSCAQVPPALAKRLDLSPEDWQLEHWRLIDPHLAELVQKAAIWESHQTKMELPVVIYPFSPVVADPWGLWPGELAKQDEPPKPLEPTIPTVTTTGRKLVSWSDKDQDLIFSRTVRPYYRALEEAANQLMVCAPLVLVLTLRSYGSKPLPFENRRYPRPQACISEPGPQTPSGLMELAGGIFRACRWWVELGWPKNSNACLPPSLVGHPRVRGLSLALSRELYMNETTGRLKTSTGNVIRVLRLIFNLLNQELDRVGQLRLDRATRQPESPVIKAKKT